MKSAKRKSASAHLAELIKISLESPFSFLVTPINWHDRTSWVTAARKAFDPAKVDNSVRTAFKKFRRDVQDPHDWRLLLYCFAEAHFGTPERQRGAPKLWTETEWCQLLADYYQIKSRNPKMSKSRVCAHMAHASSKNGYSVGKNAETIRRNVNRALNPKGNPQLFFAKKLADQIVALKKSEATKADRLWTSADEAVERSKFYRVLIPIVSKSSRWAENLFPNLPK